MAESVRADGCTSAPIGLFRLVLALLAPPRIRMKARLYWDDGLVEEVHVHDDVTTIVRQRPEGVRHFEWARERDVEGYEIFVEVDDEDLRAN